MKCFSGYAPSSLYSVQRNFVLSFEFGTEVLLESAQNAKYKRSLVHTLTLFTISLASSCRVL